MYTQHTHIQYIRMQTQSSEMLGHVQQTMTQSGWNGREMQGCCKEQRAITQCSKASTLKLDMD